MKKAYIIIVLIIIAIGTGGYFFYKNWYLEDTVDIWALVPGNAVLVYESHNTVKAWNDIQQKPIWGNLSTIPFYQKVEHSIEHLDSLSGKQGALDKLLKNKPFLFSLHVTARDDFDFLFYIELKNLTDLDIARDVLEELQKNKQLKKNNRQYQGFRIHELKDSPSGVVFSYIFYKDYFMGSFTPFLVEDAIRQLNAEQPASFKALTSGLTNINKPDTHGGSVYIDMNRLPQLLSVFSDGMNRPLKQLAYFAGATKLDMEVTEDELLLNGFTTASNAATQWLATFQGIKARPMQMKNLVPNRTALLYHFTFDNAQKWQGKLKDYWKSRNPDQLKSWSGIADRFNFDLSVLFSSFDDEIGLAVLESIDVNHPDQVLLISVKEMDVAQTRLNELTSNVNSSLGDSLYHETYGNVEIRQLNIPEFPAKLLGPLFKGFDQCFYAPVNNFLVMGSNIQVIKNLLKDMELEDTWGRSVKQNSFLEAILNEANVSLICNTSRAFSILTAHVAPKWYNFLQDYSYQIKRFEMASIQFSDLQDKFYTSINIRHKEAAEQTPGAERFVAVQNIYAGSPITTKPYVVRNHHDNSLEVFLQDSSQVVYLVGKGGRILWSDSLGAPIVSDVAQIDFYNNGKLQYAFATQNALHILDREGNKVENYPMNLPKVGIEQMAVIDYDNSKKYRFLIADENGHIYMYNKDMENLEGWGPRKLSHKLSSPPSHIRVRSKDCIIAVQENGLVNVLNRRGQMYKGFPLDLKAKVSSPVFIDIGTNFKNTVFTTVTNDGLLVNFDLEGKVKKREQLYRPGTETTFKMVIDATGRTFVISRMGSRRIAILNRKGELLFEKDYLTEEEMPIQYYNLISGNEIFAITDKVQEFTYLYDKNGSLVNARPLESSHEIALLYFDSGNKYHVYTTYGKKFSIQSFAVSY